jgi:vacuolar-type H+-ATPase subunit I/STV1
MDKLKAGAAAFGAAGAFFLLYPVLRPYSDETTVDGLRIMGTSAWVAAHLLAVGGFLLVSLGLLALTRSRAAAVTMAGAVLTSVYYGLETFGLYAIGLRATEQPDPALLELVDAVRYHPAGITIFGVGLAVLAVGAVMAAIELKSRAAIPYALGFVLFLPQFFTAPPIRMAHGLLLLVGCWLIARELWQRRP